MRIADIEYRIADGGFKRIVSTGAGRANGAGWFSRRAAEQANSTGAGNHLSAQRPFSFAFFVLSAALLRRPLERKIVVHPSPPFITYES